MVKSWTALPFGDTPDVKLKAPNIKEFAKQEAKGEAFHPPQQVISEITLAKLLTDAVATSGLRIRLGDTYEVWRHPMGIAVGLPSGWTYYVDMPNQTLKGAPKGPPKKGGRPKRTT